MQSPLCDLIIGNVPGARGPDDPDVAAAVETRGQRQKAMTDEAIEYTLWKARRQSHTFRG